MLPPLSWKIVANGAVTFIAIIVVPMSLWLLQDTSKRLTAIESRVVAIETAHADHRELDTVRVRAISDDLAEMREDIREMKRQLTATLMGVSPTAFSELAR